MENLVQDGYMFSTCRILFSCFYPRFYLVFFKALRKPFLYYLKSALFNKLQEPSTLFNWLIFFPLYRVLSSTVVRYLQLTYHLDQSYTIWRLLWGIIRNGQCLIHLPLWSLIWRYVLDEPTHSTSYNFSCTLRHFFQI